MNKILVIFCFFLVVKTDAQEFGGINPKIKWKTINTPQVKIIYPKGLDSQANHIANVIANTAVASDSTMGGKSKKWNLVLQTQTTIPNAYVRMGPLRSEFFMTPDPDNITSGSLRWDDELALHEYRHIQQFSNFNNGLAKLFTFLLGQEGQLFANGITIPDYFFEGDAVYQETLLSGQGRGRLPSFYSGMKALAIDNKKYSWMKMRNGSLKNMVPGHYELGYQIVAYGYEKYGKDFWKNVTQDASAFKGLFYSWQKAIEKYGAVSYKQFTKDALNYFKSSATSKNEKEIFSYISKPTKTVTNYHFSQATNDGSIVAVKESYNQVPTFVLLKDRTEKKIRIKDISLNNYFSYNNGKVVYASYKIDGRWRWKDYCVIQILDVETGQQRQLTKKTRYFNPDISGDGKKILVVHVEENGKNHIDILDAVTGEISASVLNKHNYFFTQTKFIDNWSAISIVRNKEGRNALVKIDFSTGDIENLTPFSFSAMGYPSVKNDVVYFNLAINKSDKIAAYDLKNKKLFLLTNNENSIFYPAIKNDSLLYSVVTSSGYQLAATKTNKERWESIGEADFKVSPVNFPANVPSLQVAHNKIMKEKKYTEMPYHKGLHLFNFHSRRPAYDAPEYSYSFLSDNILNTFTSDITYTYNSDEQSSTIGYSGTYGGFFPYLTAGTSTTFNRNYIINNVPTSFNTAKIYTGISIPLQYVSGKSSGAISFGGNFNAEQIFAQPNVKLLDRKSFDYMNYFLRFSNQSQQAVQHIFPRFAQTISVSLRDALNVRDNKKWVLNSSFYFPGFFPTHNIVVNASYQKRDTLSDLFSRTFNFSRGFESFNSRRMYKVGANYHLPILYPDFGIGNIAYIQRIRVNAFYDYTKVRARLNGILTDFNARSTGGELFFDGKIWNSFPVSIGFRVSHLLDNDLQSPNTKNVFEIVLPVGLVPR